MSGTVVVFVISINVLCDIKKKYFHCFIAVTVTENANIIVTVTLTVTFTVTSTTIDTSIFTVSLQ